MTTVSLALGGGGARGIAHIHVLEALDELGVKPVAISGTSIGAIVGAGYAAGMTGAEIREYFRETFADRLAVMKKLWSTRPRSVRTVFAETLPRFGELNPERVLNALMPDTLPANIEDLPIPLKISTADFYGSNETVLEKGPLLQAVAASAAIPVVFKPVVIDNRVLVDGGLVNPCPFDLLNGAADIMVAVDVVGRPEGDGISIPSRAEAGFGGSQLMMQTINQLKVADCEPDVFIRPPVNKVRVMDFWKVEQILETTSPSREETLRKLDAVLNRS